MNDPITILLADDHQLFRRGVAGIIAEASDMQIVGQAGSGQEALELARQLLPDLVIMDIHMPVMSGLEAVRVIKRELPHTRIIMLTVSDDDSDIFEALKCGAQGYLLKDIREDQLLSMIRGVAQGEASFSGAVAARILQEFQQPVTPQVQSKDANDPLTAREQEVLQLLVTGLSNKEIAAALHVASGTVKNHISNILYKLHLNNRLEAAVYALSHGLGEDTQDG